MSSFIVLETVLFEDIEYFVKRSQNRRLLFAVLAKPHDGFAAVKLVKVFGFWVDSTADFFFSTAARTS